jgi:hypothetical protein
LVFFSSTITAVSQQIEILLSVTNIHNFFGAKVKRRKHLSNWILHGNNIHMLDTKMDIFRHLLPEKSGLFILQFSEDL